MTKKRRLWGILAASVPWVFMIGMLIHPVIVPVIVMLCLAGILSVVLFNLATHQ